MNRQQAEHILDAYVRMRMRESDKDASDALRELILDAMTETRYYPFVTYPNRPTMPTVEPYKPTITWTSEVETRQMAVDA